MLAQAVARALIDREASAGRCVSGGEEAAGVTGGNLKDSRKSSASC